MAFVESNMGAPDDDPVKTLSDASLVEHIAHIRKSQTGIMRLIAISDSYVTKLYTQDELEDVKCALAKAEALGIPAPPIIRVVKTPSQYLECIQIRIRGHVLMDAWPSLGIFSTLRLAFQLRGILRRMRAVTNPTAGSLRTGLCRTHWLEDVYGIPPHASSAVIASVVNFWHNLVSFRREAAKTPEEHRESCRQPTRPENEGLVFTHQDLAPRNIIIESATGKPWLVDWDEAGFYPRYFEYAGMHNFNMPQVWGWLARLRWKLLVWIATGGGHERESRMLFGIQRKTTRFPAARRFNIKTGATPSVKPADD